MMGYYGSMYGGLFGFLIQILVILLIVGVVVMLLSKSNFAGSGNNERLVKVERVEEIKKRRNMETNFEI